MDTVGPADTQDRAPTPPRQGNSKRRPVHAGRILLRYRRWISPKRHDHVGVMRLPEALCIPRTGHIDASPFRVVRSDADMIDREFARAPKQSKGPAAVE